MLLINPSTKTKLHRFKSIKRGYYSFLLLFTLILLSMIAELLVNNRALLVYYNGKVYFPTYGSITPGKEFGLNYDYETNYRDLKKIFSKEGSGNFVLLPLVPYNPYENDLMKEKYPPLPPSMKSSHYLGTDSTGRDILARLLYGFRIAIFFSLLLLLFEYVIGIAVGLMMGYYGGIFDIIFQRIIEIWSNIPFLYVVIIISSVMIPNLLSLIAIMVFFGWIGMTWYIRTITYRERERKYVLAAKSLGGSDFRILSKHILPNTISLIVTFIPFSISSGISALTALDYLGFGLPAPTPSFGELLRQGTNNIKAWWISGSVVISLVMILTMVTFIGEAVREAFDPKKHTTYE